MSKKVVFILGSPRKKGNTNVLAREAMRALTEVGLTRWRLTPPGSTSSIPAVWPAINASKVLNMAATLGTNWARQCLPWRNTTLSSLLPHCTGSAILPK